MKVEGAMDVSASSASARFRLGWGLILSALLLQFVSRYLPSPQAVWVGDDWANAARSSFYASTAQAAWTGLQDSNRPLSMAAVEAGYRVFGERAWMWTLVSLAANSLLLLALMKMALELTGRRGTAFAAGAAFALLPNLTETYHWSTQVLNEVACGLVPYALSGWLWVAYLRRGGGWRLALSALAYGVGLFSYEAGILLPAAYLALLPWKKEPLKSMLRIAPIGLAGLLYVAWRTTDSFGLNQSWHYPPHMQVSPSPYGMVLNAWHLVQWWVGDHLWGAMLNGFKAFAAIPLWTRRFLFAANVGVVALIGWGLRRLVAADRNGNGGGPFGRMQVALFGLVWTGAALAISLVSYPAPRLNVLPAIGISLLAALFLGRLPFRTWAPLLFVPAVLAMVSNQGTAENYRQAGRLCRGLYSYLQASQDQWRDKEIMLVDTRSLRQRQTPGWAPYNEDQRMWAQCGNAIMLRGFVPKGMVRLITGQKHPDVQILLDVEYGARIEGDRLFWHNRYYPAQPHANAMADVFVVDFLAVGQAR
ncbi:MAG: glycosyltransferase family 39 protein [Kiritimatiellia bacterium]